MVDFRAIFNGFKSAQQGVQNIPLAKDILKGVTGGGSSSSAGSPHPTPFGGGSSSSDTVTSFSGSNASGSSSDEQIAYQQLLKNAGEQLISRGLSPDYLPDAVKLYLESKGLKSDNDLLIIGNGNRDIFITNIKFDNSTGKIVQNDTKITPEMLSDLNQFINAENVFINAENVRSGFKRSDDIRKSHDDRIAMQDGHNVPLDRPLPVAQPSPANPEVKIDSFSSRGNLSSRGK